jgi:hypothetical protein
MAEKKVSSMTMLFARCSPLFAGHHPGPNSDRVSSESEVDRNCDEETYGMRTGFQAMGRQRVREKEIRRREIEPREREDIPVGSSNFEPRANP